MTSQHFTRRGLILSGAACCLTEPVWASPQRKQLPDFLAPKSWRRKPTPEPKDEAVQASAKQVVEESEPATPAVSDSQRSAARGDRFIYVRNKLDSKARKVVYFADGRYLDDQGRLTDSPVNIALRDHYSGDIVDMQRRLLDFIWLTYEELHLSQPFFLVSGYRSPATNAWLRRKSLARNGGHTGVAKHSPHMDAIASDLRAPGRSTHQLYTAARTVSARRGYGGVGLYTRSSFVHIDGNHRRTWGS